MQVKQEERRQAGRAEQAPSSSPAMEQALSEASAGQLRAERRLAACQQELADTMSRLLHVHSLHEQVSITL